MSDEPVTSESDGERNTMAVVGGIVLFVVGAVMVVDGTRIVLFRPDLLSQPLLEFVAIFMGVLAILYSGVIFGRVMGRSQ